MKNFALLAVLAALSVGGMVASAKEPKLNKEAVKALANVPAAELPAVAANFVRGTPQEVRAATIEAVMRKVASSTPAALRHVVAAVAKADPASAVVAASAAAKANPAAVREIATAASSMAPQKAAEILAACSRVTTMSRATIAESMAKANPALSAEQLVQDSGTATEVTSDAGVATGGTIILPLGPAPGTVGYDLNGDPVFNAPGSTGTGTPGLDPDRYASAGS